MALSKRMDIRQVLAAAVFAATTSIASPLYLAVLSEQTASNAAWLAVAETLAERHGGEIIPCAGGAFSVFPEELRLGLVAYRQFFERASFLQLHVHLHVHQNGTCSLQGRCHGVLNRRGDNLTFGSPPNHSIVTINMENKAKRKLYSYVCSVITGGNYEVKKQST